MVENGTSVSIRDAMLCHCYQARVQRSKLQISATSAQLCFICADLKWILAQFSPLKCTFDCHKKLISCKLRHRITFPLYSRSFRIITFFHVSGNSQKITEMFMNSYAIASCESPAYDTFQLTCCCRLRIPYGCEFTNCVSRFGTKNA